MYNNKLNTKSYKSGNLFQTVADFVFNFKILIGLILIIISGNAFSLTNGNVPVIFRVSEGIAPGKTISVYGEHMTGKVMMKFVDQTSKVLANRQAIQTDSSGQFSRFVFPEVTPGVYAIYIQNDKGWSEKPVYLNKPDPRWISEEQAYPRLSMKLFGRNLDASEYKGKQQTEIKLVSLTNKEFILIKPDKVTPYALSFVVPENCKTGRYFIETRTNSAVFGKEWVRLNNASEHPDQISDAILNIEKAPSDPLAIEMGVAWAKGFKWNSVYNVKTTFGAKGDGFANDTRALQTAIDKAASDGGGVVFLPNGRYLFSGLKLGKGVVFKGESNDKTILEYYGTDQKMNNKSVMIESAGDKDDLNSAKRVGLQGFCNLKVGVSSRQNKENSLILCELGCGRTDPWPANPAYLTAKNLFIYNCIIDLGFVNRNWEGFGFGAAGPVLVAKNKFVVGSPCWVHSVKKYFTIINNEFDFASEQVSASSDRLLMENNIVRGHLIPEVTGCLHGIFTGEMGYGFNIWNSYLSNNQIYDMNNIPGNDAEVIGLDAHTWLMKGKVSRAAPKSVVFHQDFIRAISDYNRSQWNDEFMAVIYDGKGLGQLRKVTGNSSTDSPEFWQVFINKPWDIQPDSSSKVAIGRFHTGVVIENNVASNCCNAILLYNGCIDNVLANNKLNGTLGVLVHGWQLPDGYAGMSCFNKISGNTCTGKSTRFDNAWIGERAEDFKDKISGVSLYGNEFRNNSLNRSECTDHKDADSRSPGGFVSSQVNGLNKGKAIVGSLYEDNTVSNSEFGVSINDGSVIGALIRNMVYVNVKQEVNDNGLKTVIIPKIN